MSWLTRGLEKTPKTTAKPTFCHCTNSSVDHIFKPEHKLNRIGARNGVSLVHPIRLSVTQYDREHRENIGPEIIASSSPSQPLKRKQQAVNRHALRFFTQQYEADDTRGQNANLLPVTSCISFTSVFFVRSYLLTESLICTVFQRCICEYFDGNQKLTSEL